MFKPTEQQSSAINENGSILVTAAAGSGKTAVLVERVIRKLKDRENPTSIDRLLIVTFTNAAAAEMRLRIENRLNEEIENNPNDNHLFRQSLLLPSAQICTIDSFCINLIRENFEQFGIEPDFKISQEEELKFIYEKAMRETLDWFYKNEPERITGLFTALQSTYGDDTVSEMVLDLFKYSRNLPFPDSWLERCANMYKISPREAVKLWRDIASYEGVEKLIRAKSLLESAVSRLPEDEKLNGMYSASLSSLLDALEEIIALSDADILAAMEKCAKLEVVSITSRSKSEVLPPLKSALAAVLEAAEEFSLNGGGNEEVLLKDIMLAAPHVCTVIDITRLFSEKLSALMKKENVLTFYNTEQMSLSLLCEEQNGELVMSEKAKEIAENFDEILVDEYQDTNDLQDMLFYVLSNRESKLFVVGDIKQSIYGFRGANPANFMQKKNRYIPIEETDDTQPQKIILANNFRTKAHVCEFVNFFFAAFMNDETGDIIYNSEEALVPAAKYPETTLPATELLLINAKNSDEAANVLEAREIARYITETMNQGAVIRQDDETLRPARYSDFTILLRSAKLKAPLIAEELKKAGIPINFAAEDFAEGIEVATFLNLLTVIDNPQSDIELLSVLMSPIFGFSAEELSLIRAEKKQGTLYSAVIFAAQNNNKKAEKFLKKLEYFRLLSVTNTLQKLITLLLYETGYPDIVTAMNDGIRRRNNLMLLCDYAGSYITEGTASLSSFVRYIKNQSQSGIKSASSGLSGDAVKIMSIHASKGLQFPICIVAGCASSFNDSESHEGAIYTTELSLGFKYFDENEKTRLTTVSREVILDSVRKERLREELRLFYVAMTRTQDRLVFTGALSNLDKKIAELKTLLICSNGRINSNIFSRTKSYLEWLLLCVLLHPNGKEFRCGASIIPAETSSSIDISVCEPQKGEGIVQENVLKTPVADLEKSQKIAENIAFSYPFADILEIEAKSSVSKLANSAESAKFAFSDKPAFMNKEGLSAAGRGTAMHKVMQFFDFSKCDCIEAELERLYEWRFISEFEYKSLNTEKLKKFFESEVFERIRKSSLVKREMRFLTEIKAPKIAPHLDSRFDNENVIVQGAVDICFVEDDGVVILDFKTDFVEEIEELAETYGEQLNIYALACEKIFNKPVKQKLIYSFKFDRETEVK